MNHKVNCIILKQQADGLKRPPWPGELGKRIYDAVSQQAWRTWMDHQTTLINEHRLNPLNPKDRQFIETEMEKYFFGGGSEKPKGFVAPE
ncbi:MAG: oxidative damage protection protein [Xanthomonadales bacterium]|nr:oxidative damage protection protein [Xanthomonadales bacterium]